MGATKTDTYTTDQVRLAMQFKAIGHPARIAILEYLLMANKCICGDIVDMLPLSQPTVSQHLREMKDAGLIRGTVEGTSICYCVEPDAINLLHHYLGQVANQAKACETDCC